MSTIEREITLEFVLENLDVLGLSLFFATRSVLYTLRVLYRDAL